MIKSHKVSGLLTSPHNSKILLAAVLGTLYLVFAVFLAHTSYVASHSRSAATAGLEASSKSIEALKDIKEQVASLKELLTEANPTRGSSMQMQQQMDQLKQELAAQLAQPLQHTTKAAQLLVSHSQSIEAKVQELQSHVSTLSSKVQGGNAPAAPAAAATDAVRVDESELQHIATHSSICDKQGASGLQLNITDELIAPVVVVGCNRPGYMAKTMMTLLKYWTADPSYARKFPLFISVDGQDQRTLLLAAAFKEGTGVQVITRKREGGPKCPAADCHISQHYKLLLQLFFQCHKAPGLLFVEEDLEVAPDFFTYFEATTPLMERDSSIYCVSAWNDHGQRGRVKDNTALYRTDVMPGLGWYLNSKIGLELAPKWPLTNWDDWMRLAGIKNGRSCIYPEVSRTYTFGRKGTHMGEGFDRHLGVMQLNTQPVDWKAMDLSYLLQDNYTARLTEAMDQAEVWTGSLDELQAYCNITLPDETAEHPTDMVYKYPAGRAGFEATAKYLKPMMGDVREGTPRGSYKGHLIVRCRGRRLYLRATLQGQLPFPPHHSIGCLAFVDCEGMKLGYNASPGGSH